MTRDAEGPVLQRREAGDRASGAAAPPAAMVHMRVRSAVHAAEARRNALRLADRCALDRTATERLVAAVTELGANLWRHARAGELLLIPLAQAGPQAGVHVVATDAGPGIERLEAVLEGGWSGVQVRGGIGGGLREIRRQADRFDIHSDPLGTTVAATVLNDEAAPVGDDVAGLCFPKPGFRQSGDAFAVRREERRTLLLLLDALGEGPHADAVAERGIAAFHALRHGVALPQAEIQISTALGSERGAAMLLLDVPAGGGRVHACGIGNLRGEIVGTDHRRGIVSVPGVAGRLGRRASISTYELPEDPVLLLWTEGLHDRARLETCALFDRSPLTVAATLYRRRRKETDESAILVMRPA